MQPLTSHLFIPKNDAPCTERKTYTRASVPALATETNDTGVLKEDPEVFTEVSLRRQLLDKSRENDKLRDQIPGAARAAATNRGYSGVAKGIQ
ncbi:hypothetical protein BGY98DRAFT_225123 [Russula aff. rugulosa BPL654]|nr:hypothetical protein BGY98DRAFT_225123 [Russula aff. rugulosa BPL654]